MARLVRIVSVELQGRFVVRLGLTDGSSKVANLEKYLQGPIFDLIRTDPAQFAQVAVDHRAGTIVWPNGADIDPDVLIEDLAPSYEAIEPVSIH